MIKPFKEPIFVTRPVLADAEDVFGKIREIWDTQWLTNMGQQHKQLEDALEKALKVPNVSLFNNGTLALMVALRALDIREGEVITTPFTFPATPHCISWNGLDPVFCDINEDLMVIDEDKIESLITERTKAIIGVHVYGFPCNVEKIQKIADKHDLKVIYDAAHVFSTEIDGQAIGTFGDISMFSFHATKLYNTIEGGCLTYNDDDLRDKIYLLRNFGIRNEEEVLDIGINGKMNELQAAIGLLNLKLVEEEKEKRSKVSEIYIDELKDVEGIIIPKMPENTSNSYQYFPIKIDSDEFGISRNELYEKLKEYNVFARKYFYPLCSDYKPYKDLPSSDVENLKVANKIKDQVLCLPLYGNVVDSASVICDIIKEIQGK